MKQTNDPHPARPGTLPTTRFCRTHSPAGLRPWIRTAAPRRWTGECLLQEPPQRPAGGAVELLLVEGAVVVFVSRLEAFLGERQVLVLVEGLVLIRVGVPNALRAHDSAKLAPVERAVMIAIECIELGFRSFFDL